MPQKAISADIGEMPLSLPSGPLLEIIDIRARRYPRQDHSFKPKPGSPEGIVTVCTDISKRVRKSAECVRRWIDNARETGQIPFYRADVLCLALGTDAATLWPVEWAQNWDDDIASEAV